MKLITTDEVGQVKVGDTILPGIFESLEISGSVKMDEVEIKGKKEKVTQAVGYETAKIRFNIILLPEDEEDGDTGEAVETIQQLFRKAPDQEKPGVFKIVNKHVLARGIDEVIFTGLKTYEDNKINKVLVMCEFTEHVPIKIKVATKGSGSTAGSAGTKKPVSNKKNNKAKTPSMADFRQLEAKQLKESKKTAATPAKDTRKPGLGRKILNWLKGKDIG